MTVPTLNRLPRYLEYLKIKQQEKIQYISSTTIATDLKLNPVQVRKDLALTGCVGKPKSGFEINELIEDITKTLGYDNTNEAVLAGAGQLGKTLMSYKGFSEYGLKIVAAFDTREDICGTSVKGIRIFNIDKIKNLVKRMNIHIGIITVPAENAQKVCDIMVESGILAIWNFAPVHLNVPKGILVQNENMAASLAALSRHLSDEINSKKERNINNLDWREIV